MRILCAIPHYFNPVGGKHASLRADAERRAAAVTACITSLRQLFGRPQCVIDIARKTTAPANQLTARGVDVVVCTTGGKHLIELLPLGGGYFEHQPTESEPPLLGYECRRALRDRLGQYDFYAYLEDDLILRDPWFFQKLAWFNGCFGPAALLQPNRCEVAVNRIVHKAYVDGDIAERVTAPFQDVKDRPILKVEFLGGEIAFRRPLNPHSGCYFLNAEQMKAWAARPDFLDRAAAFVGPLESAATLGVMRAFRIYKPAPENAAFLEVEHFGTGFLDLIREASTPA